MDFIRRGSVKEVVLENNGWMTSPKDNLLHNNLNHQNSIKKMVSNTDKLSLGVASGKPSSRYQSCGSDSVFEVTESVQTFTSHQPSFTSTFKSNDPTFTISSQLSSQDSNGDRSAIYTGTTTTASGSSGKSGPKINSLSKQNNESFSSSFESEALDFLASLKSTNMLKSQYGKHNKFPTDVDPITGVPRLGSNGRQEACGKLSSRSTSSKSSCNSPTSPSPKIVNRHQPVRSPQV